MKLISKQAVARDPPLRIFRFVRIDQEKNDVWSVQEIFGSFLLQELVKARTQNPEWRLFLHQLWTGRMNKWEDTTAPAYPFLRFGRLEVLIEKFEHHRPQIALFGLQMKCVRSTGNDDQLMNNAGFFQFLSEKF